MSSSEQDMSKFTLVGFNTNSVAETFVVVICNQLRIYPTFSEIVISRFQISHKKNKKKNNNNKQTNKKYRLRIIL